MRQRSQTANAVRAHMAELGIIAATGMTSIAKFIAVLRDDRDERLPNGAYDTSRDRRPSAGDTLKVLLRDFLPKSREQYSFTVKPVGIISKFDQQPLGLGKLVKQGGRTCIIADPN